MDDALEKCENLIRACEWLKYCGFTGLVLEAEEEDIREHIIDIDSMIEEAKQEKELLLEEKKWDS